MQRSDVLTNARLSGQIRRYHTWPIIQQQTVAEHSWNVCRLWYQIFGPLPAHISSYIIWHDCGEIVTGDLPYPFKAKNPDIKAAIDRWEQATIKEMAGTLLALSLEELLKVKLIDVLDMQEFGRIELTLGNRFAQPIIDDTWKTIKELQSKLSSEDARKVEGYLIKLEQISCL